VKTRIFPSDFIFDPSIVSIEMYWNYDSLLKSIAT
jgi:hypothetical protein